MKKFLELIEEKQKKLTMLFGRMNPPTKGHEENVEHLKKTAEKEKSDHLVVASHSQDAKKNPLSPDTKLKHLKRAFPNTNIITSSKEKPTIMHHAADAHAKGYTHLHVIAGADRVDEYKRLLHHYNGKTHDDAGRPFRHGSYNFKKITVSSSGERKKGISGTDMRNHAQNNDYKSFKSNLSSHMQKNDKHAKELFHDVRKGMGLHEDVRYGMYKAIFITGGPGSGKDTVIREAIAHQRAIEINTIQAYEFLMDKQKLAEQTKDERRNAIKKRLPLIINGSANDSERITRIKEELEEFGYQTMMIFVSTTDEASSERNHKLSRMMSENIRHEKWLNAQKNAQQFEKLFNEFVVFDNTINLNSADIFNIANNENNITNLLETTKKFFSKKSDLLENDINKKFQNIFEFSHSENQRQTLRNLIKNRQEMKRRDAEKHDLSVDKLRQALRGEEKDVEQTIKPIQKTGTAKDVIYRTDTGKCKHGKFLADNNCPTCQLARIAGQKDDVRYGDVPSNSGYTFRTYHEEAKSKEPTLKTFPEPKEPNFQQDKEKIKKRKAGSQDVNKVMKVPGLGPEFSTRGSGTVYPMSGLGNVTYGEETQVKTFGQFRKQKQKTEAIDDPGANDMGVSGGEYGATNKEPMQSYKDDDRKISLEIKKKKK
jgi:predicted kinase